MQRETGGQARRDERKHLAERKRQRKAEDKKYGNYDEAQLAGRNIRMIDGTGRRAAQDLDALGGLAEIARHTGELTHAAVNGLRAQGYSGPQIGQALGVTRDAVGQRFGRRGSSTRDRAADEAGQQEARGVTP